MRTFLSYAKEQQGPRPSRPRLALAPTTLLWSAQQKSVFSWVPSAAKFPGTNLIVRSRAGTGKTTTIMEAINYIPARAAKILVCAFGKRNQLDLHARIVDPRAEARTYHSLGFQPIRDHWGDVTLDNAVEWERIDQAIAETGWGTTITYEAKKLAKKLVERAKGSLALGFGDVDLADLLDTFEDNPTLSDEQIDAIVAVAHSALTASLDLDDEGRISFDDMIFVPVAKGWITPRYDWVIVDEAQDTNPTQLALARMIVKPSGHLVFVGDEKQAIYGFRGADSGCLDRLKTELKADERKLTVTYRCPKSVVALARTLVSDFTAADSAPEGKVLKMTTDQALDLMVPGDVVLSRMNAPLVGIAMDLIGRDIRALVAGKDIGKGLVAIVKKCRGGDLPAVLASVDRWHAKRRSKLAARAQGLPEHAKGPIQRQLVDLADKIRCIQVVAEKVERTMKFPSVAGLFERLGALFQESEDRASVVTCSTVHKAKGLEWKRVFILVDTFYRAANKGGGSESEEANIMYVAITRAQETLVQVVGGGIAG